MQACQTVFRLEARKRHRNRLRILIEVSGQIFFRPAGLPVSFGEKHGKVPLCFRIFDPRDEFPSSLLFRLAFFALFDRLLLRLNLRVDNRLLVCLIYLIKRFP